LSETTKQIDGVQTQKKIDLLIFLMIALMVNHDELLKCTSIIQMMKIFLNGLMITSLVIMMENRLKNQLKRYGKNYTIYLRNNKHICPKDELIIKKYKIM